MTLVEDIVIFKKHVTVTANFPFDTIYPYIKKQERKHIKSVLGRTLYNSLPTAVEGIRKEVLELMQEASANLAMLSFSMSGTLQISGNGITKTSGNNIASASFGDLKDFRNDLLKTGSEAIDEALALLEENEADFPEWTDSSGYTDFKELFTRKTQTFQRYFNIDNSRLTFLRLKPHLLKVEDKYFKGLLGAETVSLIKEAETPEELRALELCQAAQVSLCVAEIAREGVFLLTPKGMFYKIDDVPGENRMKLDPTELDKLFDAKLEDGQMHLKALMKHLRAHPETFDTFASYEASSITKPTHNTKSIVSF